MIQQIQPAQGDSLRSGYASKSGSKNGWIWTKIGMSGQGTDAEVLTLLFFGSSARSVREWHKTALFHNFWTPLAFYRDKGIKYVIFSIKFQMIAEIFSQIGP